MIKNGFKFFRLQDDQRADMDSEESASKINTLKKKNE